VSSFSGSYELRGDTIIFKDVDKGSKNGYYSYAAINPAQLQKKKITDAIVCYKDKADTNGYLLFIVKNDLKLLADKTAKR
jgi:hypothetical protein